MRGSKGGFFNRAGPNGDGFEALMVATEAAPTGEPPPEESEALLVDGTLAWVVLDVLVPTVVFVVVIFGGVVGP